MFDRERPSFEDSNNVTVQRCFYAYEFAKPYITNKILPILAALMDTAHST